MSSENRPVEFVPAQEEGSISRAVIVWLNGWLNKDSDVPISLVQGAYIVERYIDGSYDADYPFKIIYRTKPGSPDARLNADELLDSLGQWANGQTPDIGEGREVQTFEQTTQAAMFARMEDGWEDHQIFFRMTYKVEP